MSARSTMAQVSESLMTWLLMYSGVFCGDGRDGEESLRGSNLAIHHPHPVPSFSPRHTEQSVQDRAVSPGNTDTIHTRHLGDTRGSSLGLVIGSGPRHRPHQDEARRWELLWSMQSCGRQEGGQNSDKDHPHSTLGSRAANEPP